MIAGRQGAMEFAGKPVIAEARTCTLDEVMPDVVHELNGRLSSVLGYAQLLSDKASDPETKRDLEKIIEETQRASQIIRSLVSFTRKRKPQKETLDLNELIVRILDRRRVRPLNIKNIDVAKELVPSIPLTQADPKQIQQVLLNLLRNAEEAITEFHGFGKITVKTQVEEGRIRISISDDGPGIREENLPKIFDSLFTTKDWGIGLGLSISSDIIASHGGTLRVESRYGEGTTFIMTLPIIEVDRKERITEGRTVGKSLKRRKGLVIDDEPTILDLLFTYLNHEGCQIKTALDVRTALTLAEAEEFDFVICDLRMPGMGGADFYRTMKQKNHSLLRKIIFATGDVMGDSTRAFIDSVTTSPFIEKPFNLSELKRLLLERAHSEESSGSSASLS